MKRITAIILCIVLLLQSFWVVNATETDAASTEKEMYLNWELSDVRLDHRTVCFRLRGVDREQDVTLHIQEEKTEQSGETEDTFNSQNQGIEITIPFHIATAVSDYTLTLPEETYLKPEMYYEIYITNTNNQKTEIDRTYFYKHSLYLTDAAAYPNQFTAEDGTYDKNIKHVEAMVGFQSYPAQIDEDHNITITYPEQQIGTIIQVTYDDVYGCSYQQEYEVKNQNLSIPSVKVWRDKIELYYSKLTQNERLCAKIAGKKYFSEYGVGIDAASSRKTVVSFDTLAENSVITLWVESKNGSVSEKKKYTVENCKFSSYNIDLLAYPCMLSGEVKANDYGQTLTKAEVTIGGQVYTAPIENGSFVLKYPVQPDNTRLSVVLKDRHGCMVTKETVVDNQLSYSDLDKEDVKATLKDVTVKCPQDTRLAVRVNGTEYRSDYVKEREGKSVIVSYPQQTVGTNITVWLEKENGSQSKSLILPIEGRDNKIAMKKVTTTCISGSLKEDEDDDEKSNLSLQQAYVEVNGKKYEATKCKGSEFEVTYPLQKVGSKVTITLIDTDGYIYQKTVTIKNVSPYLYVYKVDTSMKTVEGETRPHAAVTVKIGKKKYKVTADKNGLFKVKTKKHRSGTKIKISVKTKDGYSGTKTITVKSVSSDLYIKYYVFASSKKVVCKLTNARKGDKLKVTVGGKTYKKTVKKNAKTQTVSVRIKKSKAGSKITAALSDSFGKKKSGEISMVYIGTKIYKGMSAKNALLTTWGKPVRKNDWGYGPVQWVYERGSTTLYVYVSNGRVQNVQKINY